MKRIAEVQKNIQLAKDRENDYGGFAYMSIEDMIHAIKPLLDDEGLMMYLEDELVQIGERYYVKATVSVYDIESGEVVVSSSGYARESLQKKGMDESQVTGATSSYARKRAVSGLFLIDGEKDADSNEYQRKVQGKIPSDATIEAKIKTAKLTDKEVEETLEHYRVKTIKDMKGADKIELDRALTERIKKQNDK